MLLSSQDPRTGENVDKELWVTRKGATSAQKGQYGVIPGSMGVGSFITKGKGDPQAWNSCSHGAGRAMSRTKARNTILQVSCIQSIIRGADISRWLLDLSKQKKVCIGIIHARIQDRGDE